MKQIFDQAKENLEEENNRSRRMSKIEELRADLDSDSLNDRALSDR